jgi:hypothetical protein
MLRPEDACLELFLDWLGQAHGRRFQVEACSSLETGDLSALCGDGHGRLAVEVGRLLRQPQREAWEALRRQMEAGIAAELPGAYALWLPPGADLPDEAGRARDFVQQVRQEALRLEPGERSHVRLPVTLYLRKVRSEGGLMSVAGSLDAHWARMSEGVRGSYDLDGTALYRPPEGQKERQELLDRICREAGQIQEAGQWREIEAVDAWTIQRLRQGQGVTIIGLPSEATRDMGTAVRRDLRRLLLDAGQRLAGENVSLRAVVILGVYLYIEQEGATTALRGYDPAVYANLDIVSLVADGRFKPMVESPIFPGAKDDEPGS